MSCLLFGDFTVPEMEPPGTGDSDGINALCTQISSSFASAGAPASGPPSAATGKHSPSTEQSLSRGPPPSCIPLPVKGHLGNPRNGWLKVRVIELCIVSEPRDDCGTVILPWDCGMSSEVEIILKTWLVVGPGVTLERQT